MTTKAALPIELRRCLEYAQKAEVETPLLDWWRRCVSAETVLMIAEGFEERGLGVLRLLERASVSVRQVVLGRYTNEEQGNDRYRGEYERLADVVSRQQKIVLDNDDDGGWITEGLLRTGAPNVVVDISALSNRGLIGSLDAVALADCSVALAYTEAKTYWPRIQDVAQVTAGQDREFTDPAPPDFDVVPVLYGGGHRVEIVTGHEGYDSASGGLALLSFLPFKPGRLAAIQTWTDYSYYVSIAGIPRLKRNLWRHKALLDINRALNTGHVYNAPTFGYLGALRGLVDIVDREELLERFDIHVAPLGSKLQNVAVWVLSCYTPAMTMVLSRPKKYYPRAYSAGVGRSWGFRMIVPKYSGVVGS